MYFDLYIMRLFLFNILTILRSMLFVKTFKFMFKVKKKNCITKHLFKTRSNIYIGTFCETSLQLKAINCFS